MKAKTAQWKIKKALKKWGMSTEFWQETLIILREFETSIKSEYKNKENHDTNSSK
jgi:hypothetical protein